MKHRPVPAILLLILVAGVPRTAAGQQVEGRAARQSPAQSAPAADARIYIQPALFGFTRPAGTPNHRVSPPISGSALGASVSCGAFLWSGGTLALEGELAMRGTVATPQRFSYNWITNYTGEVRDLSLAAHIRWRLGRHVELFGGSGLAITTVTQRDVVRTNFPPFAGTEFQGTFSGTSYEPFVSGGVAAPVPVAARFALIPSFSVRWMAWPDDSDERYSGVGSFVYQFGVGARFKF